MSEVNHVVYEQDKVTVEQLIEWLKETGTYIRTISSTIEENDRQDTGK